MYRKSLLIVLIGFLLISQPINAQQNNEPNVIRLIESFSSEKQTADESLYFFEQGDFILRYREISLNPVTGLKNQLEQDQLLLLNLFDDSEYIATVSRSIEYSNGSFSVIAIDKEHSGYFVMSTTGTRSLGSFYLPYKNLYYKIISDPVNHQHFLLEMMASDRDILEGGPSLIPEITEKDLIEQKRIDNYLKSQDLGPDDFANVDVMVLYTPNAREWGDIFGGGIENVVAMAMANAQLVLDNSEVFMAVSLVHSGIVSYQESGNSGTDLNHFTQNSQIHQLRNQHRADLVAVFTRVNDVGGMAWLLTSRHGLPTTGFSLTRVQQAAEGYTHVHEMGHNMGLHHHKYQNFQPGPTMWSDWQENIWSAGWRWTGNNGGHFCSVMTYTSGQYFDDGITHFEVPYFSNPQITYEGNFTGDPQEGDNARTLREIKHIIASYRTSDLAVVYTNPVIDVGLTGAVSGGLISDDGGSEVLQRGVVWNKTISPTLEESSGYTIDGTGTGAFESQLTELTPGTTYYLSAYATTETGTVYGVQRIFNTVFAVRPTVSTSPPSLITHNSVDVGGRISSGGNSPVTEKGVVWSTRENPTVTVNEGKSIEGEGTADFETRITGLMPETNYYYRAFATNLGGTNYGVQQSFTTLFARVYPNPFSDMINVGFYNESENDVAIVVKNYQGQVVVRIPVNHKGDVELIIPVVQLSAGVYFLTIESEFEFPVWKLLKAGM